MLEPAINDMKECQFIVFRQNHTDEQASKEAYKHLGQRCFLLPQDETLAEEVLPIFNIATQVWELARLSCTVRLNAKAAVNACLVPQD